MAVRTVIGAVGLPSGQLQVLSVCKQERDRYQVSGIRTKVSICLLVCLSVCLSACMSVCLSVFLSMWLYA